MMQGVVSRRQLIDALLLGASAGGPEADPDDKTSRNLYVAPSVANERSVVAPRCRVEEPINGAYLQTCMNDARRDFEWPGVGKVSIEQGELGPSATGEVVWNSAQLLADYEATVLGPAGYFRGKRVIELGCGTGLPSVRRPM